MGYKMKGMDFGTGQTHGAGNSPVKFWGAIGSALAKAGGAVVKGAAKKIVGAGAKEMGKGLLKQAGGKILKGAGKLAAKGVKKMATDSFAEHQEAKNTPASNAPTFTQQQF